MVTRTLCFSRPSSCKCEYSSQISITNCGNNFYIYRRRTRDFPQCFARACTVKDKRCKRYTILNSMHNYNIVKTLQNPKKLNSNLKLFLTYIGIVFFKKSFHLLYFIWTYFNHFNHFHSSYSLTNSHNNTTIHY